MLLGIALSGVAMICLITADASSNRPATFALSPSARAELGLRVTATIANPHAITDKCFIFINLCLSLSNFDFMANYGSDPANCLFATFYVMDVLQMELYRPSENEHTTENKPREKKMGVVEIMPEVSGAISTTPLPGLCCFHYSAPHPDPPQRYGGMHTFEQKMLTKK
jgi:hypothetical protein